MLTPAWTKLSYHELQARLWRERARFICLAAGRGSGKTELSRRRVVRFLNVKKPWSDPIYFYALPTLAQARRVAWQKIKDLVPKDWLDGPPRESDMTIKTIFGSTLYVVGMDKPERIEGSQWDGGVIDESSDQKPGHFDRSVRPALSHRRAWCWRIGVPKRHGCGARDFKAAYQEYSDLGGDHAAYTWPSWSVLPPEEIEAAKRSMDSKDFEEQYGAAWQTDSGLIFHAFSKADSVSLDAVYEPSLPIIVGSDFNVSPMAWVLMQRRQDLNKTFVFDEIWLRNTNTQATLDFLYQKWGQHVGGWLFIGDATARSRNTRASLSDYAQIENDTRFKRHQCLYPKSNPAVVDRFAATNAHLCNAANIRQLLIHPKCTHLIDDLETRAYLPGSREPDDYDDVGHITDALGYPIHYLWPVRYAQEGTVQVSISTG